MEWKVLRKNYQLASGKVADVPDAGTDLTYDVDPDGDDAATWQTAGAGATHTARLIDSSDTTYIWVTDGDENNEDIFSMETYAGTITSCDRITVNIRAYDTFAGNNLRVDISNDNWVSSEGENNQALGAAPFDDYTAVFNLDPEWTSAEVAALEVKVIAPAAMAVGQEVYISEISATLRFDGDYIYRIELQKEDEDLPDRTFDWTADQWIDDVDNGLLIEDDTTGETTVAWAATGVEDYGVADANVSTVAVTTTITHDGANIDNSYYIKRIRIHHHTYLEIVMAIAESTVSDITWTGKLKNQNGGDDYTFWTYSRKNYKSMGDYTAWHGQGLDEDGVVVDDISIEGTPTELEDYMVLDAGDYGSLKLEFSMTGTQGQAATTWAKMKFNYLSVSVDYATYNISPVMEQITDNGDTWVETTGLVWAESGCAIDDRFSIGENCKKILQDIALDSGVDIYIQSTTTKYMARWLRGVYCLDALQNLCDLEGFHWWEDYTYDRIVVSAETDFVDSGVDLTNSDYLYEWEIHDEPNAVSKVHVYGNAALRIYAFAEDIDGTSPIEKMYIDDKILTKPDAQEIADEMLAELSTKRKQIKIPLQGVNSSLGVGLDVHLTMTNPTIAQTLYPISKIERNKGGYVSTDDIWTTIYCGLGSTTWDEKMLDRIERAHYQSRRNASDRLSTTPYSTTGATITWDDITGATVGARNACIEDDAYGAGWDGDTSHAPTQNAVYDKINAMKEGATYGYEHGDLIPRYEDMNAAGRMELTASADWVGCNFYVDDDVDASADLLFTYTWMCTSADASVGGKQFVRATKTDGSEAISWNIENGTAANIDSTTASRLKTWTYTLANADFDADDLIGVVWYLNEAARAVYFYSVVVKYTYA
jgi:hypothetical protein